MRLMRFLMLAMLVAPLGIRTLADDKPATQPAADAPGAATLKPDDKDGIAANMNKDVVIEGVVDKAEWSGTGKVLKATFKDGSETKLSAILFVKNREAFDKAFSGDVAKALTGAKVRVKGQLKEYRNAPEIQLDKVDQLTIVEAAS